MKHEQNNAIGELFDRFALKTFPRLCLRVETTFVVYHSCCFFYVWFDPSLVFSFALLYSAKVNGVTPDKPPGVRPPTTPTSKIEETPEIKPPPPKAGQTPRIHDIAKSEQLKQDAEKDRENEKKKELEKERERERGREPLLRKTESVDAKDKKTEENEVKKEAALKNDLAVAVAAA